MSDFPMTRFQALQPAASRSGASHPRPSLRTIVRTYLTRQSLVELTPRQREDIGVSSSAALAEAARLPWDISPRPSRPTAGLVAAIQTAIERVRTRHLISRMEARELRDAGI